MAKRQLDIIADNIADEDTQVDHTIVVCLPKGDSVEVCYSVTSGRPSEVTVRYLDGHEIVFRI